MTDKTQADQLIEVLDKDDTWICDHCGEEKGYDDGGPFETPEGDYICLACYEGEIEKAEMRMK